MRHTPQSLTLRRLLSLARKARASGRNGGGIRNNSPPSPVLECRAQSPAANHGPPPGREQPFPGPAVQKQAFAFAAQEDELARSQGASCLKRTLWGCGGLTALAALMLGLLALLAFINQPSQPDVQPIAESGAGSDNAEAVPIGATAPPLDKPVRLTLDIEAANFRVFPDAPAGKITVDGNYDVANYELETDVEDRGEYIDYRVSFKYAKGMRFQFDDEDAKNNKINLRLPRDLLLDLAVTFKMGLLTFDLSGLSLRSLEAEASMGLIQLERRDLNPVPMKNLSLDVSMANCEVKDLQNFRFAESRFETSMAETKLFNSGPFAEDATLHLKASMGAVHVMIPEANRMTSNFDQYWGGEVEGPREHEGSADAPLVHLQGMARAGGIVVSIDSYKRLYTEVMDDIVREQGVDAAIEAYRAFRQSDSAEYSHNPNALRELGYGLLEDGLRQEALAIFQFNAGEYPDEPRSYRGLAAAQRQLGLREEAIASLEKALEINPDYRSARRMLRELQEHKAPGADDAEDR